MNVALLLYCKGFIGFFLCLCDSPRHWWSVTPPIEGALTKAVSCSPSTSSLSPGKNPEAWAKDLKQEDFQLLCLDGTRKPVTEAQSCHLAIAPSHAVVSRKDKADFVRRMLFNQQVWEFSPHPRNECLGYLQSCTGHIPVACPFSLGSGPWLWWMRKAGGCAHFLLWGCLGYHSGLEESQTHGYLKRLPETHLTL